MRTRFSCSGVGSKSRDTVHSLIQHGRSLSSFMHSSLSDRLQVALIVQSPTSAIQVMKGLAGLWYLFFDKEGERFRVLGWAWLVTAAVIMTLSPRIYYLFTAYPVLFAAGSVAWERWLSGVRALWIKRVYVTLMVLMATLIAP